MSLVDTNKDGKVTKQEFLKHHETIFDQIDANKDGAVDQPEADGYAARIGSADKNGPAGGCKKITSELLCEPPWGNCRRGVGFAAGTNRGAQIPYSCSD